VCIARVAGRNRQEPSWSGSMACQADALSSGVAAPICSRRRPRRFAHTISSVPGSKLAARRFQNAGAIAPATLESTTTRSYDADPNRSSLPVASPSLPPLPLLPLPPVLSLLTATNPSGDSLSQSHLVPAHSGKAAAHGGNSRTRPLTGGLGFLAPPLPGTSSITYGIIRDKRPNYKSPTRPEHRLAS
jgi:hypothetical protein